MEEYLRARDNIPDDPSDAQGEEEESDNNDDE
jgi:hypothetical protein